MRSRVIGLLMSIALCMPACLIYAQAPTPEVPSVVRAGFDSLKAAGFEAGIRGWLKGSPIAQATTPEQMREKLGPVLTAYGDYVGYDILGTVRIGDHVTRVYTVIRFALGPLYGLFDCYQSSNGWIVTTFLFNAQPALILPTDMLRPH